jgi:hypothetical protein
MKKAIWIDTSKALLIDEQGTAIEHIESPIQTRVRVDGESDDQGKFGGQAVTHEKQDLHRRQQEEKDFNHAICKKVDGADELLLFGPGEAKKHLFKHLVDHHSFDMSKLHIQPADSMTENQVKAFVREYFES